MDQRRYRKLQAATVTLQKHYRAHRATVKQRSSYLKTLQNIKILRARVHGHIEYRRFQRLRASAITIQVCNSVYFFLSCQLFYPVSLWKFNRSEWFKLFLTLKQAHYRGMIERRRFQHLTESHGFGYTEALQSFLPLQFIQLRKSGVVIW